jgi:calcium-dependent protein kinase
LATKEEMQEL